MCLAIENMEKTLIVLDKEYRGLLFEYRKKNPNASFKLLDKEEFLNFVSFSFSKDPIPFLLKKGYDYTDSKRLVKLLRVADLNKSQLLKDLYDELNQEGYTANDELGWYEVSHMDVCLLEMMEDKEIHQLGARKGIPVKDLSLFDLGLEEPNPEDRIVPPLLSFKNKFMQFAYIYSDIRARLLKGEDPYRFKIHISSDSDLYYVHLFSSLFGLESYLAVSSSLKSDKDVAKALHEFYTNRSFVMKEENLSSPSLMALNGIIKRYGLEELPFARAYPILLEITNDYSLEETSSDKGVMVVCDYFIDPSSLTYVTDFIHGDFYRVYDDKNVFSDEELLQMGANPSYVLTALDRRKKLNYIRYSSLLMLSRVDEHLSDAIYSSQFMNDLPLYAKKGFQKVDFNPEGVYTDEVVDLLHMKEIDDAFYYRPVANKYHAYDHSFKGIKEYKPSRKSPFYSVTNLEQYRSCPFRYYLNDLIPTNIEDRHNMYLGTLIHKVMEHVYDDSFSFEEAFKEGKEAYRNNAAQNGDEIASLEEAYFELYYRHLKRIVCELRKWKVASSIKEERPEETITWVFRDEESGKDYPFKGRIDKLVKFQKENGPSYYYIIDYKTGAESFKSQGVFLGVSTQLPLYYFALNSDKKRREELVDDALFGGFGIQQMYFSSLKKGYGDKDHRLLSEETFYSYTSIKGITLSPVNQEFWDLADRSYEERKKEKKNVKSGYFLSKEGSFENQFEGSILDKKYEDYSLSEMIGDAIKSTLATIHAIENASFPIAPTGLDVLAAPKADSLACKYCSYRDVCYRIPELDMKSYRPLINAKFKWKTKEKEEKKGGKKDA